MAKLKHNSPKALNYCFFQEVWLCRKSRVQWAFTPFSEQHVRAPGPRGAFVRLSRAGPAGTEGESRDRQRGWAGTGLDRGSEHDFTPSFSGKEIYFARTNHWHAFFISVIIPKKGCGKALRCLLPLGEFYKGRRKEGSRAEWQLLLVFCCAASKLIFPISSDLMPKPAQIHKS